MISHHASNGLVWLDVSNTTEEEIAGLIKRYGLDQLDSGDLIGARFAQVDFFKDAFFTTLPFPGHTLTFIIGKNFLITIRTQAIEQLDYVARVFESNSLLKKEEKMEHGGHLFYYMLKRIYAGMHDELINIEDRIVALEAYALTGSGRAICSTLANISRELAAFTQATDKHDEIWGALAHADLAHLFSKEFRLYTEDIRAKFSRNSVMIMHARDRVAELRRSVDSLILARHYELSGRIYRTLCHWTIALGGIILVAVAVYIYGN